MERISASGLGPDLVEGMVMEINGPASLAGQRYRVQADGSLLQIEAAGNRKVRRAAASKRRAVEGGVGWKE